MDDLSYFRMRAQREREAADRQQHQGAREAHLAMAEHYERLIAAKQPR